MNDKKINARDAEDAKNADVLFKKLLRLLRLL